MVNRLSAFCIYETDRDWGKTVEFRVGPGFDGDWDGKTWLLVVILKLWGGGEGVRVERSGGIRKLEGNKGNCR